MSTLDKINIAKSFTRAANTYDTVAVLQREVGKRLLDRLDYIHLKPKTILDIGCGTGLVTQQLAQRFNNADIIALDIAQGMLLQNKQNSFHKICADAEQLPFANHSVDFIFSNLVVHWSNDLNKLFSELNRVLKPEGLLLFSTLGPDTLIELRSSWAQVDEHPHVHLFLDMHDIGDVILKTHFKDPVMDVENFTLTYPDIYQLMRDLKLLGAKNLLTDRHKGLTGKNSLQKLIQSYEGFRIDNLLPATYEVIYGHAWGAELKTAENEITFPIKNLRVRNNLR